MHCTKGAVTQFVMYASGELLSLLDQLSPAVGDMLRFHVILVSLVGPWPAPDLLRFAAVWYERSAQPRLLMPVSRAALVVVEEQLHDLSVLDALDDE